ncbi:MAG: hypothetical protein FJY29_03515 [Betaproteobacteria bacterium]|nr:hypothetical protein [Betaproteobacteria bacterium]
MRVDMLTLYAFSDKAHAKQRELWRGFLALVVPVVVELDPSEFERLLESSQCRSVEQMLKAVDEPEDLSQLIWSVSGQFSEILGFEPELGLAAFLDVSLPTRVHSIGLAQSDSKDNAVITGWLKSFREVQQRPEFLEITQEWKRAFDILLEDDELEVLGDEEDAESSESNPTEAYASHEASESEPVVLRRARKRRKTG